MCIIWEEKVLKSQMAEFVSSFIFSEHHCSLWLNSYRVRFPFLFKLRNSFLKCVYFAWCEVSRSCQKWVTGFPWWYSVGVAKIFIGITFLVSIVCNVKVFTLSKGGASTGIIPHRVWPTSPVRKFDGLLVRVISRVFSENKKALRSSFVPDPPKLRKKEIQLRYLGKKKIRCSKRFPS